jgi:hypothetical protein
MRTIPFALLLAACAADVEPVKHAAPSEMAALPPGLNGQVSPNQLQSLGREFEILINGANPNALMALAYSDGGPGNGPCPPFLQGNCMDITGGTTGVRTFMLPRADGVGDVVFQTQLPQNLQPGSYVMQALALSGGQFTGSDPFFAEFIPFAQDCATPGANEPNDRAVQEATALSSGDTSSGVVCYQDRTDWYSVPMVQGQLLSIDVSFTHADGDLDVYVLEGATSNHEFLLAENAVATSDSIDDDETIDYVANVSRRHYIAVRMYDETDATEGNGYTISVTTSVPSP